jgi:hypothetical protein
MPFVCVECSEGHLTHSGKANIFELGEEIGTVRNWYNWMLLFLDKIKIRTKPYMEWSQKKMKIKIQTQPCGVDQKKKNASQISEGQH